ncbi:MAG: hypothetical protein ACI352_03075 [Elusimicrobiaceae bacterium]
MNNKLKSICAVSIFGLLLFSVFLPVNASCVYGGKTLNEQAPVYSTYDECETCVRYCCPNGEMSDEDCTDAASLWSYSSACANKMSKCKSGYTEGSDGTCCANSSKPRKTTAYLGYDYSGSGWVTTSGTIKYKAVLNVSSPYCRSGNWYVKVNSYTCTSPLSKTSDGCKMYPYWSCFRRNYPTIYNGLSSCSGSAANVGALLDSNPSVNNVYGPGSYSDCSYECSYKDNNRKYHECECDIALEDFEVTVESEYRASELKF